MIKWPDYIGASAYGIKMGVIIPGADLLNMVYSSLEKCSQDGLLSDGDTICITESVLARAQNNYVKIEDIVVDLYQKMNIHSGSTLGVLFPLLSRNRFSLILKGLAAAVKDGKIIVQLSHPTDEVGNQLLPLDFAEKKGIKEHDVIPCEVEADRFKHPITQVDYIGLYYDIIKEQRAQASVFLCNDPLKLIEFGSDGIVVANIHGRNQCLGRLKRNGFKNAITLQELCNEESDGGWSEWGLLGSNLSSNDKLKLAPRHAEKFALDVQERVLSGLGKKVEVVVYGDGAYCDPSTGIYELADPQPALGKTPGLVDQYREGLKFKYVVDKMLDDGHSLEEITFSLSQKVKPVSRSAMEAQGTTPRKMEDLIASLADLISGSADAGTPLIIVKGFLNVH